MKNHTPARQELKKRGWHRRDRTVWGEHIERWVPSGVGPFGLSPNGVSFESACRKEKIEITEEDKI